MSAFLKIKGDVLVQCTSQDRIIKIPSGIKVIAERAFIEKKVIEEVVIPEGVTTIKDAAFYRCVRLKKITLPNSLAYLGESVFAGCHSLKSIVLPASIHTIPKGLLRNCYDLSEIIAKGKIEEIGAHAFKGCKDLGPSLEFLDVKSVGLEAFCDCESLTTIKFGKRLEELPKDTFVSQYNPKTKIEKIEIDPLNKKYESKDGAVYLKGQEEPYILPFGMKREVIIDNSVKVLMSAMIGRTDDVSKISIPDSIEDIEDLSVRGVPDGLLYLHNSVYYLGNKQNPFVIAVKVDKACAEVKLEEGCKVIADAAFDNCFSLGKITFPSTLKTIGSGSFHACLALKQISIPESVSKIKRMAFSMCTNLKDVYFSKKNVALEEEVFQSCVNITNINILPTPSLGFDIKENTNKTTIKCLDGDIDIYIERDSSTFISKLNSINRYWQNDCFFQPFSKIESFDELLKAVLKSKKCTHLAYGRCPYNKWTGIMGPSAQRPLVNENNQKWLVGSNENNSDYDGLLISYGFGDYGVTIQLLKVKATTKAQLAYHNYWTQGFPSYNAHEREMLAYFELDGEIYQFYFSANN